jgi:hypothetical protein
MTTYTDLSDWLSANATVTGTNVYKLDSGTIQIGVINSQHLLNIAPISPETTIKLIIDTSITALDFVAGDIFTIGSGGTVDIINSGNSNQNFDLNIATFNVVTGGILNLSPVGTTDHMTMYIYDEGTLNVNGGTVNITPSDLVTNPGGIEVNSDSKAGTFNLNSGIVNVTNEGWLYAYNDGTININGGQLLVNTGGDFEAYTDGAGGTININAGAEVILDTYYYFYVWGVSGAESNCYIDGGKLIVKNDMGNSYFQINDYGNMYISGGGSLVIVNNTTPLLTSGLIFLIDDSKLSLYNSVINNNNAIIVVLNGSILDVNNLGVINLSNRAGLYISLFSMDPNPRGATCNINYGGTINIVTGAELGIEDNSILNINNGGILNSDNGNLYLNNYSNLSNGRGGQMIINKGGAYNGLNGNFFDILNNNSGLIGSSVVVNNGGSLLNAGSLSIDSICGLFNRGGIITLGDTLNQGKIINKKGNTLTFNSTLDPAVTNDDGEIANILSTIEYPNTYGDNIAGRYYGIPVTLV